MEHELVHGNISKDRDILRKKNPNNCQIILFIFKIKGNGLASLAFKEFLEWSLQNLSVLGAFSLHKRKKVKRLQSTSCRPQIPNPKGARDKY